MKRISHTTQLLKKKHTKNLSMNIKQFVMCLHTATLNCFCSNTDLNFASRQEENQTDYSYGVLNHLQVSSALYNNSADGVLVIHDVSNLSYHEDIVLQLNLNIHLIGFISSVATLSHEFLITGDFNTNVDDPSDNYSQQFLSILSFGNLTQHVSFPTHRRHHSLDLVMTTADSSLVSCHYSCPHSPSGHVPVISSLNINAPKPSPLTKHSFRSIKSINIQSVIRDILSSTLITHPSTNASDLVHCYNSILSSIT
jgi:hypothetical protein